MNTYEPVNKLYIDENYIKWKQYYDEENIWNILNKTVADRYEPLLLNDDRQYMLETVAFEKMLKG